MGFFRSRFNNNSARKLFHSSGVIGDTDGKTIGSTSSESFEQRQKIEGNRRLVGGYRDAGIMHTYRQEAQSTTIGQQPDSDDKNKKHHHRNSMVTDRPSSRVRDVPSSRIDIMKPSSRVIRDTGVAKLGTESTKPAASVKRTYMEPVTRKYNPYQ
ncbi:MAG TPA: hypothetical protein VLH38_05045 [Patescibacteria group bacterium]|nr:hypothetical protein [Patescibacteria group bacterium]